MRMLKGTNLLLGILTLAGIAAIIVGSFILSGDAKEALLYMGGGTSALGGVLLVENYRRRNELKKASVHVDQTD